MVYVYFDDNISYTLKNYGDSEYAGCTYTNTETRKSTSGCIFKLVSSWIWHDRDNILRYYIVYLYYLQKWNI